MAAVALKYSWMSLSLIDLRLAGMHFINALASFTSPKIINRWITWLAHSCISSFGYLRAQLGLIIRNRLLLFLHGFPFSLTFQSQSSKMGSQNTITHWRINCSLLEFLVWCALWKIWILFRQLSRLDFLQALELYLLRVFVFSPSRELN